MFPQTHFYPTHIGEFDFNQSMDLPTFQGYLQCALEGSLCPEFPPPCPYGALYPGTENDNPKAAAWFYGYWASAPWMKHIRTRRQNVQSAEYTEYKQRLEILKQHQKPLVPPPSHPGPSHE